jgi:hypothetical protein
VLRGGLVVIVCLVGVLALAGPSHAATHKGQTSQGKRVALLTKQDELTRITFFEWRSRCSSGGRFTDTTSFKQPLDRSAPGLFFDRSFYRFRQPDGNFRIRVKVRVRGNQVSPRRWKGVFKPTAVVKRNGNEVATCSPGKIRWRATR